MSQYYILQGRQPVPATITEWAQWFETAPDRVIKKDVIPIHGIEIQVSTVFLGMDHSFTGGPLEIFETMIFGGTLDQYQDRYATYDEAEAGHAKALALVTEELAKFKPVDLIKPFEEGQQELHAKLEKLYNKQLLREMIDYAIKFPKNDS